MNRLLRGFTLIEVLIALIVLAVAGAALAASTGRVALQTAALERSALAHWVVENHWVRMQLSRHHNPGPPSVGEATTTVILGGRRWRLQESISTTEYPLLYRVELQAYELVDDRPTGPFARQVGFLGRH